MQTFTNGDYTPPSERRAGLPPELLDRIIDFLHDDSISLAHCSLVCRLCLPTASFHLFRSLHVRTSGPLLSASKRWQVPSQSTDSDLNRRACSALLRTLEHSVRLRTHVKRLHLEVDHYGTSPPGIELGLLGRILTLLPHLRALHINTPHIHGPFEYPDVAQLPFKRLQSLCFSRVRLSMPLFEAIRWFSRIDRLVFRRVQDADGNIGHDAMDPYLASSKVSVKTLLFGAPGSAFSAAQVLSVLCRLLDQSSLEFLDITALAPYMFPSLENFLRHVGNHLKHLAVAYDSAGLGRPNPTFIPLDLPHCPQLTTLHIIIVLDINRIPEYNGTLQWDGVLEMIRRADLFSLQSLVLWCQVSNFDGPPRYSELDEEQHLLAMLQQLKWTMLDEVVSHLLTHSLRAVDLIWHPEGGYVHTAPLLRALRGTSDVIASELSTPVKAVLSMRSGRYR